ncbi:hypothetical protein ABZ957_34670, partial [Streptomyces sp. NPDC046316]|uniref:hypothetical protein n=1 Tax=Streptomyces sp. NPDC046316 TaxID=3154494 RepID=UPI0033C1023D
MTRLTHKPERIRSPPHIEHPHRRQHEHTLGEQPQNLDQDLPDPLRPRLTQIERPIHTPTHGPRIT